MPEIPKGERIAQIVTLLRGLPQALSFDRRGLKETAGRLICEAIDLGLFADPKPEYLRLRAMRECERNRDMERVWVNAVECLLSYSTPNETISDRRSPATFGRIADVIEHEANRLNGQQPNESDGVEWSKPMSKSEVARILVGEKNARPREIEDKLAKYGMETFSVRKVRVRIDTMPPDLQDKFRA